MEARNAKGKVNKLKRKRERKRRLGKEEGRKESHRKRKEIT